MPQDDHSGKGRSRRSKHTLALSSLRSGVSPSPSSDDKLFNTEDITVSSGEHPERHDEASDQHRETGFGTNHEEPVSADAGLQPSPPVPAQEGSKLHPIRPLWFPKAGRTKYSLTQDMDTNRPPPAVVAEDGDAGSISRLDYYKDECKTLLDLAIAPIPRMPPVFHTDFAAHTKGVTQSERNIASDPDLKLEYVVFVPDMLERARQEIVERLKNVVLDWNNLEHVFFAARCLPIVWEPVLPKKVWREFDVGTWCLQTMFRPTLALLRTFPPRGHGDPSISRWNQSPYPSLCGAPQYDLTADIFGAPQRPKTAKKKAGTTEETTRTIIIPDGLVVSNVVPHKDLSDKPAVKPEVLATMEIKTPNVWLSTLFLGIADDFVPIQVSGDVRPGVAARRTPREKPRTLHFEFPHDDEDLHDKRALILSQTWNQLVGWKSFHASLSCHRSSIFCMRSAAHPNTLYISKVHSYSHHPNLYTLCLWADAAGLWEGTIDLPAPDRNNALNILTQPSS
ncbi:hypothetical protein C8Q76DRAFT_860973 [Earliella scabrosa]|nr:hypothetical protein C8Q76DRAFT_860973 [Earliella scabrosa]